MRKTRLALVVSIAGALLAGGCSGHTPATNQPASSSSTSRTGPTSASGTTSPSGPRSAQATPTSVAAPQGSAAPASASARRGHGCVAVGGGIPAGATKHSIIDIDRDGRRDIGWIRTDQKSGSVRIAVTTASGATFGIDFVSASPINRSALFGDADGNGRIVMIVSDGREAFLYVVRRCAITPVTNPEGRQYTFDLGLRYGNGTGVGCLMFPGIAGQTLVGLKLVRNPNNGDPESVTETQILIRGATARNGKSFTAKATDRSLPLIQRADQITCGEQTFGTSGVILPNGG